MRERAELFGGTLTAGPHDGGFEVRAVLPYES
jgi:signal transduction histidine kinase